MKNKHLIVHIGMQKTGSTSIQQKLYRFIDDKNFEYVTSETNTNNADAIFSLFSATPESFHLHQKLAHSRQQIDEFNHRILTNLTKRFEKSTAPHVIISAESITTLKESELKKLKQFLDSYFDRITIVGYVRTPRAFMESKFQQVVQSPNITLDIEQFYPRYRWKFEKLDNVFGQNNVSLWKFDPSAFYQGDVVLDFCQRIGIKVSKHANKSLSKEALQLLVNYRKHYSYGSGHSAITENWLLIKSLKQIGEQKVNFSPEILKPVFDRHQDDIAWIEHRLATPMLETFANGTDDICSLEELTHISYSTVAKLKILLETDDNGEEDLLSPEAIAQMMHDLRLKLIDDYLRQKKQGHMTIKDLVQRAKHSAPEQLGSMPDMKAVGLIREVFKQINVELKSINSEIFYINGLGSFIRRVEDDDPNRGKSEVQSIEFKPNPDND